MESSSQSLSFIMKFASEHFSERTDTKGVCYGTCLAVLLSYNLKGTELQYADNTHIVVTEKQTDDIEVALNMT